MRPASFVACRCESLKYAAHQKHSLKLLGLMSLVQATGRVKDSRLAQ